MAVGTQGIEHDPTPRTMQFEINRSCPSYPLVERVLQRLPLAVFIDLRSSLIPSFPCGGKMWRIVEPVAISENGDRFPIRAQYGHFMAVCEHMGHLIE